MKKKKWNITKLMVVVGFAVLNIIIGLVGMSITLLTGFTSASGLLNSLTGALLTVLMLFTIQKFGAATLNGFIFSVIALPLPLMLTPGFLPKILIGLITGLVADLTFTLCRKKPKLAAFLTGTISQFSVAIIMYLFGIYFNLPGMKFMNRLLFSPLTIIYIFLTGFSGILGLIIYNKIKHSAIIKRIQK